MNTTKAAITGVTGYVPDFVLTNEALEKMVDTSDEWITSRTGIRERHILKGEGQGVSVMAAKAVQDLLDKTGTAPAEVEALICATVTPDYFFPNASNLVCEACKLTNAFCFDLSAACSGFVHGLTTAANFIESGRLKKVVLVGADKMSSITDYTDRSTCVLFGDGAGAVLLEATESDNGILDFELKQDPVGKDYIYMKGGGSAYPATKETLEAGDHSFTQHGRHVFKYAVNGMESVAQALMNRHDLSGKDIAFLVPHQANGRILEAVAKSMGLSMDKVTVNIEKYGNTTSATIPLCLWEWEEQFQQGDNLILASFGAGFNWGAVYLKWAY